jgi:hypothetical protein
MELWVLMAVLASVMVVVLMGIYGVGEDKSKEIICLQCKRVVEVHEVDTLPAAWVQVQRVDTSKYDLYCCTHCLLDSLESGEKVE